MPAAVTYITVLGQVLMENRGGIVTEFVPDPLGSVVKHKDSSGAYVHSAEYWPYGEIQTSTGNNPNSFAFCGTWGYYRDNASQTYVRARYYKSAQGRWMTPLMSIVHESYLNPYSMPESVLVAVPGGMKKCAVYKCEVKPGKWGPKAGHTSICVSIKRPDGSSRVCSGGLYPHGMNPGNVVCGPGRIGDGDYAECPPTGDPDIRCVPLVYGEHYVGKPTSGLGSDVCSFANNVCKCLDDARRNPGGYMVGCRNCTAFPLEMIDCACRNGDYGGLLGKMCRTWYSEIDWRK